ncbi:hypothetical protein ACFVYR_05255 [Streptomyces sp. NPDC058284]|uniref:hypothetical protein n=1 Tax=unclassified Streptomyces TaxID=2593676 RepID=UPI00364D0E2E
MPHTALRRTHAATVTAVLAAATFAAVAPSATAADASAAAPPSLKVLTYNTFLFSRVGQL